MGVWLLDAVLDSTPEATWASSREDAMRRLTAECVERERVEIAAFDGDQLVGFVAMVAEEDGNVGPCLSLLWNYVKPSHRGAAIGRHFMRRLVLYARQCGLPTIAYTHRLGLGRYELTYRRLHG